MNLEKSIAVSLFELTKNQKISAAVGGGVGALGGGYLAHLYKEKKAKEGMASDAVKNAEAQAKATGALDGPDAPAGEAVKKATAETLKKVTKSYQQSVL